MFDPAAWPPGEAEMAERILRAAGVPGIARDVEAAARATGERLPVVADGLASIAAYRPEECTCDGSLDAAGRCKAWQHDVPLAPFEVRPN